MNHWTLGSLVAMLRTIQELMLRLLLGVLWADIVGVGGVGGGVVIAVAAAAAGTRTRSASVGLTTIII